jgi:glycine cleavage system pyridoxal-binding protein P
MILGSHHRSVTCRFGPRHNALSDEDVAVMLKKVGASDLDSLMNTALPPSLRRKGLMDLGKYTDGMSESEFLEHFKCASCLLGALADAASNSQ